MADIIQLLPNHVANQIAAGEVVQRPASAVKELLENAIDAKSTHVKLIIKDSGKTLIQVIDNGIGMSVTDVRMAFERHATSKIKVSEDLFKIHTKGFRGEALASIAAVSQLECITNSSDENIGTKLQIDGGKYVNQENIVSPKGTSILVKNLFYNVPARRNFLKSDNVELRHIINEFQRVAIAHPDISFDLYNSNSIVFNLPKTKLKQRISNIFGNKMIERLVPIKENTDIISINGFIIKPQFSKKSKGEQFFFVNNRFVRHGYLHHAVTAAFEGLIHQGHIPSYFLFLDVNPKSIDINIHPTKTEIKFEEEHSIYAILKAAVKYGLGQFKVIPQLDFETDSSLQIPYNYKDKIPKIPEIKVDKDFNPFKENSTSDKKSDFKFEKKANSWEALYTKNEIQDTFFKDEENTSDKSNSIESSKAPIFQLQQKYIISTIKSGIIFLNQNRAHQRILYEEFLTIVSNHSVVSQQLLFPLELEFSVADIQLLKTTESTLKSMGFDLSFFEKLVRVKGIPPQIKESEIENIFKDLINDSINEVKSNHNLLEKYIAKSIAKSAAIKTGDYLNKESQETLISKLFSCREQQICPFKKPIFVTLNIDDIKNLFAK